LEVVEQLDLFLPFSRKNIEAGLKYFCFELKPSSYRHEDWLWLIKKIQGSLYGLIDVFLGEGG
jgi:hypothetical protein